MRASVRACVGGRARSRMGLRVQYEPWTAEVRTIRVLALLMVFTVNRWPSCGIVHACLLLHLQRFLSKLVQSVRNWLFAETSRTIHRSDVRQSADRRWKIYGTHSGLLYNRSRYK